MAPDHSSVSDASSADGGARKRVCKACDRCRLKKSKCDGARQCSRCKADNAICVFGERKKSQDKVYPKGYVEMLEQQQAQLITGLQELYKRARNGQGWKGKSLENSVDGHPLTHDILYRLGALKGSNNGSPEIFEENLDAIQQRLIDSGADYAPRQDSPESESDGQPSFYDNAGSRKILFNSPFGTHQAPPTPPMRNSYPSHVQTPQASLEYDSPASTSISMSPADLQQQAWPSQSQISYDDSSDMTGKFNFLAGTGFPTIQPSYALPTTMSSPCQMSDWTEEEIFSSFLDPTVV
ncbi:MAG: hypothetical protein M1812_000368 [Candelaria pacifica]|nr:MAG: hypothetical protein M1812_000368 [Candelaria pacifica]